MAAALLAGGLVAARGALAGSLPGTLAPSRPAMPAAEPVFTVPLDSCSYGGAAVADLDGDGDPEIVFGTYYNDERVVALHHDGSVAWAVESGGGPVDNSVTVADLDRDGRPEVVWGNSETNELHVADAAGRDRWSVAIGEVLDAPKAVGDLDGDARLELVVASCGADGRAGGLRVFDGATGELHWTARVGGCYQSAPLLFDQDGDGLLDVVVSAWFDEVVRAFSGRDGSLRWERAIGGWTYHAGSFGDLSGDGVPDVFIGDYAATVWAIDGRDGSVLWSKALAGERYLFGPTAMGDLDGDKRLDVLAAGDRLWAFDATGKEKWSVDLPGYGTRGPVLADVDGDGLPDVVVASDGASLGAWRGRDGSPLLSQTLEPAGSFDFQPAIADLDGDGLLEAFGVYGRGQSDTPSENWGRAVAVALGARGQSWPTFGHDHHHSGNYHMPPGEGVNAAGATGTATATATGGGTATRTAAATGTPAGSATHGATEPATATRAATASATGAASPTGTAGPTAASTATSTGGTATPSSTGTATPLFLPRALR